MRKAVAIGIVAFFAVNTGCHKRDETESPSAGRWERGTAHAEAPVAAQAARAPAAAAAAKPAVAKVAPVGAPAAVRTEPAPAPKAEAAPARSLVHASRSVDELMTKLLAALAARDLDALERLRVTEAEHTNLLWPEFPAKDHNVQPALAWDMLNSRSHIGAGRAIGDWGGQELELLGVEFTRDTERYPTFVLHRGTLVHARASTGETLDLPFCGSVLELDGQWKLLSFKD
jgi:hypothetical protein